LDMNRFSHANPTQWLQLAVVHHTNPTLTLFQQRVWNGFAFPGLLWRF
jgi:hypothetical protein